jgi:hypothetical protein
MLEATLLIFPDRVLRVKFFHQLFLGVSPEAKMQVRILKAFSPSGVGLSAPIFLPFSLQQQKGFSLPSLTREPKFHQ